MFWKTTTIEAGQRQVAQAIEPFVGMSVGLWG